MPKKKTAKKTVPKKSSPKDVPALLVQVAELTGLWVKDLAEFASQKGGRVLIAFKKVGLKPTEVEHHHYAKASVLESEKRSAFYGRLESENTNPQRKHTYVSVGHGKLDPQLNPAHPLAPPPTEEEGKKEKEVERKVYNKSRKAKRFLPEVVTDEEDCMKVSRDQMLELFLALGFKTAPKWSPKEMRAKIAVLDSVDADADVGGNENLAKLLKRILSALKKEEDIIVTAPKQEEEEDKSEAKESEDEEEKVVAKKGQTKTSSKGRKPSGGNGSTKRDKYGSPEGSRNAAVNQFLSKKPKSIAELVKEAKVDRGGLGGHMKKLVDEGFVEKTEDKKYKLVK